MNVPSERHRKPRSPVIRELSRAESEQMLLSHRYGRLAFTFRDRVDIEPIGYVYESGWIHGRTTAGTKLETLSHHPWVAFEIDDVMDLAEWRSVVVKGTVYFVEQGTDAHQRTLETLRRALPETLTDADPFPERSVLFRIHVDEVIGRAAEPA